MLVLSFSSETICKGDSCSQLMKQIEKYEFNCFTAAMCYKGQAVCGCQLGHPLLSAKVACRQRGVFFSSGQPGEPPPHPASQLSLLGCQRQSCACEQVAAPAPSDLSLSAHLLYCITSLDLSIHWGCLHFLLCKLSCRS